EYGEEVATIWMEPWRTKDDQHGTARLEVPRHRLEHGRRIVEVLEGVNRDDEVCPTVYRRRKFTAVAHAVELRALACLTKDRFANVDADHSCRTMSRHLNGILSGPATNLDDGLSPHFPPDVLSHNCFEPTPTVMRALLGRVSISAAESSKEVIGNSAADEAHNVGSPEDDSRRAMHN